MSRLVWSFRQLRALVRIFIEQPVHENFIRLKRQVRRIQKMLLSSNMSLSKSEKRFIRMAAEQVLVISNMNNSREIIDRINFFAVLILSYAERIGIGRLIRSSVLEISSSLNRWGYAQERMDLIPLHNLVDNLPLYIADAVTNPGMESANRLGVVFEDINQQVSRLGASAAQREALQTASQNVIASLVEGASPMQVNDRLMNYTNMLGETVTTLDIPTTDRNGLLFSLLSVSRISAESVQSMMMQDFVENVQDLTGPTGESGATGAQGVPGVPGAAGSTGAAGARGATGAGGARGAAGAGG
ncbi:collagen-like repeat preface domain-containing protein [Priestia sp. BR_2]